MPATRNTQNMASISSAKKQCVGMWSNGVPIYAEEQAQVQQLLDSTAHQEVAPDAGLATGQIPWLIYHGKLYSKPGEEHVLAEFAKKHLAGMPGADKIGSPAIHLLTHCGEKTALAALEKFFPGHVDQARAIVAKLASELDALEARVEQIAVPLSYADELYSLRSNIGLVRSRLK